MKIEQYIELLHAEDPILEEVLTGIRQHDMPEISVSPAYGRLLTLLVRISNSQHILEIGALGGYSGISLCRGMNAEGTLTSLELKQTFADVAKEHLTKAGYGDRVEYKIGAALDRLQQLEQEGRKFDFFFIDADKENYPNYLESAIRLALPGAIIVGDNTLLRGRVSDSSVSTPSVEAMRKFNYAMTNDPRLEGMLLPSYDGLAIARVRS